MEKTDVNLCRSKTENAHNLICVQEEVGGRDKGREDWRF